MRLGLVTTTKYILNYVVSFQLMSSLPSAAIRGKQTIKTSTILENTP